MTSSIPRLQDGEQTVYFQAGGEWCFLKTPKSYSTSNGAVPCVIQCHGHTATSRTVRRTGLPRISNCHSSTAS